MLDFFVHHGPWPVWRLAVDAGCTLLLGFFLGKAWARRGN